ncbi:MAG: transposase [Cupriavidus sp.]|nr:MAG: transposase [Cupriavidus sp.]
MLQQNGLHSLRFNKTALPGHASPSHRRHHPKKTPQMPDYRRYFVPGGTYFFTVVTADRRPLFQIEQARLILGQTIREELTDNPFEQIAIVLLPDHLHAIWALPPGDQDYSRRWKSIKSRFTRAWLAAGGTETKVTRGYDRWPALVELIQKK